MTPAPGRMFVPSPLPHNASQLIPDSTYLIQRSHFLGGPRETFREFAIEMERASKQGGRTGVPVQQPGPPVVEDSKGCDTAKLAVKRGFFKRAVALRFTR